MFVAALVGIAGVAVVHPGGSSTAIAAEPKSTEGKKKSGGKGADSKSKDAKGSGSKSKVGQSGRIVELAPLIVPMIRGKEIVAMYSTTIVVELKEENKYEEVTGQMAKIRDSLYVFLLQAVSQRGRETNVPSPDFVRERAYRIVAGIIGGELLQGIAVKEAKTSPYAGKEG